MKGSIATARMARRWFGMVALATSAVVLASCAGQQTSNGQRSRGFSPTEYGVPASQRVVEPGQSVPRGGGVYRIGRPYTIRGRTYFPAHDPSYDNRGQASWYGDDFHGRRTANGEIYDMYALSAAHRTLPLPSYVRVTNPSNGRSVIVRINDRGPYHGNRIIDLSKRAAMVLDMRHSGVGNVRVQYVGRAPLDGNDDQWLITTVRHHGTPMSPQQVAQIAPIPDWAARAQARRGPPTNGPAEPTQTAAADTELPRVDQAQAVRRALSDQLAPLPPERPRDQALQTAALSPMVPEASRDEQRVALPAPQPPIFSGLIQPVQAAPAPDAARPTPANAPIGLVPLPPERPIPATRSSEAPSEGRRVLHAGSYRDPAQARRVGESLSRFGAVSIERVDMAGLAFHQVRVGPLDASAGRDALRAAQAAGAPNAQLLAN